VTIRRAPDGVCAILIGRADVRHRARGVTRLAAGAAQGRTVILARRGAAMSEEWVTTPWE